MCGRFVGAFSAEVLMDEMSEALSGANMTLSLMEDNTLFAPNFNTAPTHTVPILRHEESVVVVDPMQWGLVPSWSKDPSVGSKMINARSETITEKPSFRQSVPGRRCIIPMSGFYEWDRSDPKRKVPYFVTREDGHLMLVAGIWTPSPALDGRHTFSLITRESVDDLSYIHSRSPVELHADDALEWMCNPVPPLELFQPEIQPRFSARKVSTLVNSVRNNSASLLDDFVDIVEAKDPDTLF
ncbi:MAG: SOS response-associated peptidase [Ilumatobacteraceae bacterium]